MTTTQMLNYYFAYNLSSASGETRWSCVPDDVWQKLLNTMTEIFRVDAVGFQNIESIAELRAFPVFSTVEFSDCSSTTYAPYHQDSATTIAAFRLDSEGKRYILTDSNDDST